MLSALEGVGVAASFIYSAWLVARCSLALARVRDEPELTDSAEADAVRPRRSVTLMQPILSGDPELEFVLSETLARTPDWARFLWLVDEGDAAGREVAERLARADAGARVAVRLCPPSRFDQNPKSMKLALGLSEVATPFVGVLDDDTIIGTANLCAALNVLGDDVRPGRAELYTGLPSYDLPVTFGAPLANALLASFVNDSAALTYLPLQRWLGAVSINGMFYVAATERMRASDAFHAIEGELCDDYALAQLARREGWRIHQGSAGLRLRSSLVDLRAYRSQMHRWFVFGRVLVRDQPPGVRCALALAFGAPPVLLWLSLAGACAGWLGAASFAGVLSVRGTCLRRLGDVVFATRPGPRPARRLVAGLVAELAQPLHFMGALVNPRIQWRSRAITVGRDGAFREACPAHRNEASRAE
ncbi:MAG: glycosyltransferase [Planctomycetota bacterium]